MGFDGLSNNITGNGPPQASRAFIYDLPDTNPYNGI